MADLTKGNSIQNVMESLMQGMDSMLGTKTVVGDPVKVDDTVIIPLLEVSFGVGAGSSDKDKKDNGAGGFCAKMSPSAVLIIKDGATRLVNVKNQDAITKLLDMVPDLADKFTHRNVKMMDDEKAVDIAFPEGTEDAG